jgi:purine-binding chemotaxis protein CheW
MAEPRQYCTFLLDSLYFGVEVKQVQEVIRYQTMTPVPMAPPTIRGLINLRGQIVTAIDLRRRLELKPAPEDKRPMNVVVHADSTVVSLLVDQIGDVVEVEEESFEKPPDTLSGSARELILGAHKLDKRLLLVLDTRRIVSLADEDAAVAGREAS